MADLLLLAQMYQTNLSSVRHSLQALERRCLACSCCGAWLCNVSEWCITSVAMILCCSALTEPSSLTVLLQKNLNDQTPGGCWLQQSKLSLLAGPLVSMCSCSVGKSQPGVPLSCVLHPAGTWWTACTLKLHMELVHCLSPRLIARCTRWVQASFWCSSSLLVHSHPVMCSLAVATNSRAVMACAGGYQAGRFRVCLHASLESGGVGDVQDCHVPGHASR